MDIDTAQLAILTVTNFLLPYAKLGADELAKKIGGKVGEGTASKVAGMTKNVWQKVTGVFTSERDKGTLEDFQEMPDETADLLIKKLQKKLEENPELVKELQQLIEQPVAENTSGAQIMHAHIASIMDFRNADFRNAQNLSFTGISKTYGNEENDNDE